MLEGRGTRRFVERKTNVAIATICNDILILGYLVNSQRESKLFVKTKATVGVANGFHNQRSGRVRLWALYRHTSTLNTQTQNGNICKALPSSTEKNANVLWTL